METSENAEAAEYLAKVLEGSPEIKFSKVLGEYVVSIYSGNSTSSVSLSSAIYQPKFYDKMLHSMQIILDKGLSTHGIKPIHMDLSNFKPNDSKLLTIWINYRETLNAIILQSKYVDLLKKEGRIFWKRRLPFLKVCLRFSLVLFVFLNFPGKAKACIENEQTNVKIKLKTREYLTRVILAGAGLVAIAGVATVAYLALNSPKTKLASRLLAASSVETLASVATKRPEFLKVPEFLSLPVSNKIAAELLQTLEFLKVVQFDKSFADRRNLVESSKLLTILYDRMEGLLNFRYSPEFNGRSMRSIESSIFLLCRKSLSHKQVCQKLKDKQMINGLILALAKHAIAINTNTSL